MEEMVPTVQLVVLFWLVFIAISVIVRLVLLIVETVLLLAWRSAIQ